MKLLKILRNVILCAVCAFSLTNCAPAAAIVVGATAGGAIIYDKRTFKTMHADQHAANMAQYNINHDPLLKDHSHISIAVYDGIGLLVGQAPTTQARARAADLLKNIKGIRRSYNAITIGPVRSTMQRAKDAYITSKVRTALLTKSGLKSNDIKVLTEDHVVYLLGSISMQQANLATEAARKVSGVAKIVKVFQYA